MYNKSIVLAIVALVLALTAGPARAELVGHWRLNEGAGTTAYDTSGNHNDGTLQGDPQWVAGILGGALQFDGVDDFVEVPHSETLTVDNEVTVMAWINAERHSGPGGAGWQGILAKSNSPRSYSLYTTSSGILHFSTSGGNGTSMGVVPLNEWVHVAVTAGPGGHTYFINGESAGEGPAITLPGAADTASVVIGKTAEADREFLGMIDDVRIYNHALTDAELQESMKDVPFPLALAIDPPDGGMIDQTQHTLKWGGGDFAASHSVYIGESLEAVSQRQVEPVSTTDAQLPSALIPGYAGGLTPGQTYYWRVDEVNETNPDSPWEGNVWSFTVRPLTAWDPAPTDAVNYVRLDQLLSWEPGIGALFHTVYFGETFEEVDSALAGTWMTPESSYDPGSLEAGKTYYWRVDEFSPTGTAKGEVWSFTALPEVAVTDPDLVGWWTLDEGMGITAVDWSGRGNHGTIVADPPWVDGYHGGALEVTRNGQYVDCGVPAGQEVTGDFTLATWVRLAPGNAGVYAGIAGKLTNPGMYMGFALVRHSSNVFRLWVADGDAAGISGSASSDAQYTDTNWHHIVGVREGQTNALYVDGVRQGVTTVTDFVPSPEWFHIGRQYSHLDDRYFVGRIDDVRVYSKALTEDEVAQVMRGDPLLAADPEPGRNALVDIRDVGSLRWTAGDTAASHNVYLGTDRERVAAAGTDSPEYQGNQPGMSLSLAGLVEFGGGDYYWRVDEVEADGTTVHTGYVWNFTVPDYLIADGFDGYTNDIDAGEAIFQTWIDGWENGTTSTVGYEQEPFAEQNIIYSGSQSMPLDYNNVNSPYYAEAERTWATPQDWTANGVETLTLFVRGQADNAPAMVYVALKDSAGQVAVKSYPDDTATTATDWIRWDIALSDFAGVNAAGIKTMYLGVGDRDAPTPGGAGLIYIDDIRVAVL